MGRCSAQLRIMEGEKLGTMFGDLAKDTAEVGGKPAEWEAGFRTKRVSNTPS